MLQRNNTMYYNFTDILRDVAQNHPSVQRVTMGDRYTIDNDAFPEYPLANWFVAQATFSDSLTVWRVQLTIADKIGLVNLESIDSQPTPADFSTGFSSGFRVFYPGATSKQTIRWEGDDTVLDCHANSFAIVNDIVSYLQYSTNAQGLTVQGDVTVTPFRDRMDNGLCGTVAEFDIVVNNPRPRCLYNLLP